MSLLELSLWVKVLSLLGDSSLDPPILRKQEKSVLILSELSLELMEPEMLAMDLMLLLQQREKVIFSLEIKRPCPQLLSATTALALLSSLTLFRKEELEK
jgi:hypothetical protein